MNDIELLEKQREEIREQLNRRGWTVKNLIRDFIQYDYENGNNFENIKALIAKIADELKEEKAKLSNLNNTANQVSSNLLSVEKALSDEMYDLEVCARRALEEIKIVEKEHDEMEKEMENAKEKLKEAQDSYAEAKQELDRRDLAFLLVVIVVIVINMFFRLMSTRELRDFIKAKEALIKLMELNISHLKMNYILHEAKQRELALRYRNLEIIQEEIQSKLQMTNAMLKKSKNICMDIIIMDTKIIKWIALLQELQEKVQIVQKHRALISAAIFRRQKDAIKNEIEQIITGARELCMTETFQITKN